MSYTSAKQQQFNKKNGFIGRRLNTCYYRFHKMIDVRRTQIPKIAENPTDEAIINESKQKILNSCDEYVNCLRNDYSQLPQYLEPSVNNFKKSLYTDLAQRHVLHLQQRNIVEALYSNLEQ